MSSTVSTPFVYLALPVMDETELLPRLIAVLRKQSLTSYELVVCVNQPDRWWYDQEKREICLRNSRTLEYLEGLEGIRLTLLDRSTPGRGWQGKNLGVGWARKTAMDAIVSKANNEDIIISIDADTTFHENYLQSVCRTLKSHPEAMALSLPYYHHLTGDGDTDRCMLRYEIYMRYYFLNMWRITNPYAFTALGSAMALPVWAYRKVGGITPHRSGEDFYFMQKLCKQGRIIHWNEERVYPAARFSDRVFFGTGPAMIRGRSGDWSGYPIYHYSLFDKVRETYDRFDVLFKKDVATPMDDFLYALFGKDDTWRRLRHNYRSREPFIRACTARVDGLRILQYLKTEQKKVLHSDEENLKAFIRKFYPPEHLQSWNIDPDAIDFGKMDPAGLNHLRDFLSSHEDHCRQSGHFTVT